MKSIDALLTNHPVPWHPALRLAVLDAAFIQMCSHSIDAVGEFDDVVVNDFGQYGVSVDVICIEREHGLPQFKRPPTLHRFAFLSRQISWCGGKILNLQPILARSIFLARTRNWSRSLRIMNLPSIMLAICKCDLVRGELLFPI